MDRLEGYLTVYGHNDTGWFHGAIGVNKVVGVAEVLPPDDCRCIFEGRWQNHHRYGKQFRVERFLYAGDEDAIYALLSGGFLKHVKEARAKAIAKQLGARTFAALDDAANGDPTELLQVSGIGPKNVIGLVNSWREQRSWAWGALDCAKAGLSLRLTRKIRRHFGDDLTRVLRQMPYRLTQVSGIDWQRADEIAMMEWPGKEPVAHDDPHRYAAALREVLLQERRYGHLCSALEDAVAKATELCQPSHDLWIAVQDVLDDEGLVLWRGFLYDMAAWQLDSHAAALLVQHLRSTQRVPGFPDDVRDLVLDDYSQYDLDNEQCMAVYRAFEEHISIITGGPGSGKSSTVQAIVNIALDSGLRVVLCSFTAKAADRLHELTDYPASTIHSILKVDIETGESGENFHGDIVVVDEAETLDAALFYNVLAALPRWASVVFVGDKDQLPPIGAGEPFNHLVVSDIVPTTTLQGNYRAAEGVIQVARQAVLGVVPSMDEFENVFLTRVGSNQALPIAVERVVSGVLDKYDYIRQVEDLFVLSTVRKNGWGQEGLNQVLKSIFNPGGATLKGVPFAPGDRVMHIKNNRTLGVMNGMTGTVTHVLDDATEKAQWQEIKARGLEDEDGNLQCPEVLWVNYRGREVGYTREVLSQLDFGWAATVHKTIGSEYLAVVLVLPKVYYREFYCREIPYTAMTRAKRYLHIISAGDALECYLEHDRRLTRRTNLTDLIQEVSYE